jgi:hypothetical protein
MAPVGSYRPELILRAVGSMGEQDLTCDYGNFKSVAGLDEFVNLQLGSARS